MRVYHAFMQGVSVSAAASLLYVEAPTDAVVCILRGYISQQDSEVSNQLGVKIQRCSNTDPVGGNTITPEKAEDSDAAFGGIAIAYDGSWSTPPSLSGNPFFQDSFNVLNGWQYVPGEREMLWLPPGGACVLHLLTAPAAALTMDAGLIIGEVG